MRALRLFFVLSLFLFAAVGLSFAESEPAGSQAVDVDSDASDLQWAWGEVVKTDAQDNSVTVKYLDFESGQEKEISVFLDSATVLENFKALSELNPSDTLSVDYVKDKEGKGIAKILTLEKPASTMPSVVMPGGGANPEGAEKKPEEKNLL